MLNLLACPEQMNNERQNQALWISFELKLYDGCH